MGWVISLRLLAHAVLRPMKKELTIVRHGQNGNLSNRAIASFNTSSPFVDGGQISVHVTRITTATGDFFASGRNLSQSIAVRGQICENDQNMLFELISVVFSGCE